MKRLIIVVLTVALFMSARINAQDFVGATKAGTIPTSKFFYRLDILGEDVWQNFLGIFGDFSRQAQLDYLEKRIQERESEAWEILSLKGALSGPLSDEALEALKRKQGYRLKAVAIAVQGQDDVKIREIQEKGWNFDFEYAKYIIRQLDGIESQKNDLRNEIAEAIKANDSENLKDLVSQMKRVRLEEDDLLARNKQVVEKSEMASEKLENILTGAQKAELLFKRIEHEERVRQEKKQLADTTWKKLLSDLDIAKKKVADDKILEVNDLINNLQKLLRDVRVEEDKEVAAKLEKEDVEVEKPQKPVEQVQKPALKKIPSKTVNTSPLVLIEYAIGNNYTYQGEVGQFFKTWFFGEGGLRPYYFQLETGAGFPPIGIILDTNGVLSGTPSTPGTSIFGVCVVDTSGKSACHAATVIVDPAGTPAQEPVAQPVPIPQPVPQPEPQIKEDLQISISSRSCISGRKDAWGEGDYYWVDVSGTASGPEGTKILIPLSSGDQQANCGSWSVNSTSICYRKAGDPAQTQWSFRASAPTSPFMARIELRNLDSGLQKNQDFQKNCP